MAESKVKFSKKELEEHYRIADALASAYEEYIDNSRLDDDQYRRYVFGVLLHTPNPAGIELIDRFDDPEHAYHIANLVLRRFNDKLPKLTVDF